MSKAIRISNVLALFVVGFACGVWVSNLSNSLQAQAKQDAKAEAPDDSKLYVWPAPEKGTQTMLVLKAIDGEQLEAAFLVPVTVVVDYRGKKRGSREQLETAAGGRLLPFDLRGRDRFGRLTADAYLGKATGWLTDVAATTKVEKADKK